MKYNLISKAGLTLMLLSCAGLAHAEFEIKNVRCADAGITIPLPEHHFHFNGSPVDKTITVQITKDGCKPKGKDNGRFNLRATTTSGTLLSSSGMIRVGRLPSSATETFPIAGVAYVFFNNLTTTTTRGTFSYSYAID